MPTLPEHAPAPRSIGWSPGLGSRIRDGFISILLFGLAVEWLLPLMAMSPGMQQQLMMPILLAFALFLLPEALGFRSWGSWVFRGLTLFGVVGHLFYDSFPALTWLREYRAALVADAEALGEGRWQAIGGENRTVLFLAGWMLLLTSVQSLVLWRKRALWLVACSAVYLLGLQWWLGVDTSAGLVRSAVIGLTLAALLRLPELEQRLGLTAGRHAGWPLAWLAAGGLLTAAALGAAWGLARPLPVMPPVPPLTVPPALVSWAERWGLGWEGGNRTVPAQVRLNGGVARTGYGDNDFRLGGPIAPDEGIAFIARTPISGYWRGEAKTVYDGKGWIQVERTVVGGRIGSPVLPSEEAGSVEKAQSEEPGTEWNDFAGASAADPADEGSGSVREAAFSAEQAADTVVQEIWLQDRRLSRVLFAAGSVDTVEAAANAQGELMDGANVRFFPTSGKVRLDTGEREALAYYRVRSAPPLFAERVAADSAEGSAEPVWSDADFRGELQLPDTLPSRVAELAESIVRGQPDELGRALALQRHLRDHYAYSMDRPGFPEEQEDFVDRFLFVEKTGYCDHFSTALAVLLRTVGIPSRWVKGFAPGEESVSGEPGAGESEGMRTVVVRNKHAHSWVEAYIAPYGWVTLEPTPGFAGGFRPAADGVTAAAESASVAAAVPPTVTESVLGPSASLSASLGAQPTPAETSFAGAAESAAAGGALERLRRLPAELRAASPERRLALAAMLVASVAGVAAAWRGAAALRSYLRRRPPAGLPLGGYGRADRQLARLDRFWQLLFRRFGSRPPHQTLREYALAQSARPEWSDQQKNALLELTGIYEAVRFGGDALVRVDRQRLAELWRILTAERPPRA